MGLGDSEDDTSKYTSTATDDLNLVSTYTGLNFSELMQIDCITFKMLIRDAFIAKMRRSEEGREYLQNCWLMKQTEPDRKKLKKEFNNA